MSGIIYVHPTGAVSGRVMDTVRRDLKARIGRPVEIGQPIPVPESALDASRGQYRAIEFLNRMKRMFRGTNDAHLAVTDVDLFAPGLNFVFGSALSPVAIFSTARLDPRFYGERTSPFLTAARAGKEAVHEVGHVLGLQHCDDPKCVMWFSSTLSDTDAKGPGFCERHAYEIARGQTRAA